MSRTVVAGLLMSSARTASTFDLSPPRIPLPHLRASASSPTPLAWQRATGSKPSLAHMPAKNGRSPVFSRGPPIFRFFSLPPPVGEGPGVSEDSIALSPRRFLVFTLADLHPCGAFLRLTIGRLLSFPRTASHIFLGFPSPFSCLQPLPFTCPAQRGPPNANKTILIQHNCVGIWGRWHDVSLERSDGEVPEGRRGKGVGRFLSPPLAVFVVKYPIFVYLRDLPGKSSPVLLVEAKRRSSLLLG